MDSWLSESRYCVVLALVLFTKTLPERSCPLCLRWMEFWAIIVWEEWSSIIGSAGVRSKTMIPPLGPSGSIPPANNLAGSPFCDSINTNETPSKS